MTKNTRHHSFTIMLSILLCVVLSSCTANAPSEDVSPAPHSAANSDSDADSGDLRILATLEEQSWIVDEYKRKYPGREVVWDYAAGDALLEKLASAPAPDLVIAGNELLNTLSGSDLFENMGQEPYLAGELIQKKWFHDLTLTPFTSMDGQSLIAIPKDFPMAGTFYRADLLEKYGFPSDPEGLAAFMESPQNWIRLAETLKSHDVGVIGYTHEVLHLSATGYGYFDQSGNYSRNTEELAPYASLMLDVESKELASNWNMWDDKGQQAIREGKLALLYMGEWGFDLIKQWDPEHFEQWKFTRLPFNAYWVHGGSFFSIMRDSPNKASAWEYIQLSMELELPYRESLPGWAWHSKVRDYRSSPLAAKAEEIWSKQLQSLIQTDISGPQLLQTLETRILEELGRDLEIYHELLSDTLRN